MTDGNQQVIDEFRANGGRMGGMFEGTDLLLLTTTGARSGRPRTSPVGYAHDGDRLLIFGSNAGLPAHPAWFHNLLADPRVTVELGTETFEARAVPVTGPERDRLYAEQGRRIPAYAAYQERTARVIPVVALHRVRTPGLAEIHQRLRADLAAVRADRHDLRAHCLAFCGALRAHHTNEDRVFPRIEARFPELRPAIERLRREHTAIARRIAELEDAPDDAVLDRLAADLEAHFAFEEEHLTPVLDKLS
ncbi:nitroreductase/quinone reductase family protein [Dactylosporangium fulvum]|uniref:Nitroreductase/quinone reductase family protein n=1 Tax=Dactylosporangium fulvum TaxID=53359 RepID=A0ABY5VTL6_9ACTN|nr:nitroreductase/quinone reductase family protein [Dactylosporangium fulvum]UWP81097.1 nitroreductase/quinone reductase family protein [Dactylosporangium fulvum]